MKTRLWVYPGAFFALVALGVGSVWIAQGKSPLQTLSNTASAFNITTSPFVETWTAGEGFGGGVTLVLNKDGRGWKSILGNANPITWSASGREISVTFADGSVERGQLADDGQSFTLVGESGGISLYLKRKR